MAEPLEQEKPKGPKGQQLINALRFRGVPSKKIDTVVSQVSQRMIENNYSNQEVKDFFGFKEPDMSAEREYVQKNLQEHLGGADGQPPREARDFTEAFEAGLQISVTGLAVRQDVPDIQVPEDPGLLMTVSQAAGTLAGDIPAMVAGGVIGAASGGGLFSAVTGTAGAFGAPAALRAMMMEQYTKGDIKSAKEFWDRLKVVVWEQSKGMAVGAATAIGGAGAAAGAKALGAGAKVASQAAVAGEITAMTAAGAGIEGELPEPEDFMTAAILVAGARGSLSIAKKMRGIYVRTGLRPHEVLERMEHDHVLRNEVLSEERVIPEDKAKNLETFKPPQLDPAKSPAAVKGEIEAQVFVPKDVEPVKSEVGKPKLVNKEMPRTPEELEVLGRIGETVVTKESRIQNFKDGAHKFYMEAVDSLHYVNLAAKQLSKGKLDPAKDPYVLARLNRVSAGITKRMLDTETVDFKSMTGKVKITGKGLEPILKSVKDVDGFKATMMALRDVELSKRGIKGLGVDIEVSKKVATEGMSKYGKEIKELVGFQDRILQYAVDAEILSPEASARMRKLNKFYIPFHRMQEVDPFTGNISKGNPFKGIKGSDKLLEDPLMSIYKNTAAIVKAAERNRVMKSLAELAESSEGQGLMRKSKAKLRPETVRAEELVDFLQKQGLEHVEAVELANDFQIFRPQNKVLRSNEFQVFRSGKREVWETTQGIADSINSLDANPALTATWQKIFLKTPAELLRFTVTTTPEFVVKNFGRDSLTAFIQGRFNQIPVVDSIIGLKHIFKNEKVWRDFLSQGGASQGFANVNEMVRTRPWILNEKTGFMNKSWNVVKTPFEMLNAVSSVVENMPRFAEFRKGGGGAHGAFAAREVTLDFMRMGLRTKAMNAMTPFMNVGIQGIDKTIRVLKSDPSAHLKAGAAITMPTVLNWMANKDDPRYFRAPAWERNYFWVIPTDKWVKAETIDQYNDMDDYLRRRGKDGSYWVNTGVTFKVPKPFEFGLLYGSLPESLLDSHYRQDPASFEDFGKSLVDGIMPNIIPTIVQPMAEQATNRNFFTDRDLVPDHLQKYETDLQYQPYTSEVAKKLGQLVKGVPFLSTAGPEDARLSSPAVIDNYIRGYTGSLGQYALDIADKALTAKQRAKTNVELPADSLADIPFIKAFVVRHPSFGAEPIQKFYDAHSKNERLLNSVKKLYKEGKIEEALERSGPMAKGFVRLTQIRKAISNTNKLIQKVKDQEGTSAIEKRQLIDSYYYQMIRMAEDANKIYDEVERARQEGE